MNINIRPYKKNKLETLILIVFVSTAVFVPGVVQISTGKLNNQPLLGNEVTPIKTSTRTGYDDASPIPQQTTLRTLPSSFDLRNVNGTNYVTSVKSQQGGTCWTFGSMAAMESNLLMTGNWAAAGESNEPNLAEYHLDWWNGFNQHNNDDRDPPEGGGLVVHEGGDYLVTAAYLTRGEGAVRDIDGQSYDYPPARSNPNYHYFYPQNIEWYIAGSDLSNISIIKEKVMTEGAVGTCICYDSQFIQTIGGSIIHYQPPTSLLDPNHAVAIVGWNDDKITQAPQPGAWLCKNSWGTSWGSQGYFWISYYDKWAGQHPEMGAVSFQGVEPLEYTTIYYHDYHGWRDTKTDCSEAFNAFIADDDEHQMLNAVSFFTATDNVDYTVTVYDSFENNELLDARTTMSGTMQYRGFHTMTFNRPLGLTPGDDFYIYLWVSAGGQPFDRSSDIPVLLGATSRTWVESAAQPGQSYYRSADTWLDLYDVDFGDEMINYTANFCIKGLASAYRAIDILFPTDLPRFVPPDIPVTLTIQIKDVVEDYVPDTALIHYRYDNGDFFTLPLTSIDDTLYEVTLPPPSCGDKLDYYFSAEGSNGTIVTSPSTAPTSVYTAYVGFLTTMFQDNFETDTGWAVQNINLMTGAWERGVPIGGGVRGDPPTDYDGSGSCYVTGNAPGDVDVDGGPTRLISPTFDLSTGDYYQIEYARWFFNDNHDGDPFFIEISNDNGNTWVVVEKVVNLNGGWVYHAFNVTDFITPTALVKVRFSVTDNPSNSITEAGIDAFKIMTIACYSRGDLNCDNNIDFGDINPFVLALTDPAGYDALYGCGCNRILADINGDGIVNIGDINPFVALLSQ